MNTKPRFLLYSALLLLGTLPTVLAQQVVNQSIHLGAGSSHFSTEGPFNGCGVLVNAGWQKTLKNRELRFSPDLTAGFYDNNCTDNLIKANYTSLTLRGILNYDFIQAGNFAAFIGGGPVINYSFGNTFTDEPNVPPEFLRVRETQFHPGVAVNVGLRFLPGNGRLGFEMIPVNVQFDFSDYAELIFFARFFYSLDARRNPKVEKR